MLKRSSKDKQPQAPGGPGTEVSLPGRRQELNREQGSAAGARLAAARAYRRYLRASAAAASGCGKHAAFMPCCRPMVQGLPKGSDLLIRFFESDWFDTFIALT